MRLWCLVSYLSWFGHLSLFQYQTSPLHRWIHAEQKFVLRLQETHLSYDMYPVSEEWKLKSISWCWFGREVHSIVWYNVGFGPLKGQCHEIFCFWFFYESVSPQPQSIPLRPFQIFSKIRGDIHSSRLTTGVADTGGKWKKYAIRKILIILLGHLWIVELTYT